MHLSQNLTAPMSENRPGRCVSLIHHTMSSWQSLPQEHVKFISESHRHKVAEISLFSSLYREKISNELNEVYQSTERSNFRGAPANPKASILNLKQSSQGTIFKCPKVEGPCVFSVGRTAQTEIFSIF